MKDKILFLDIDGVINSVSGVLYHREIVKRDENGPTITTENVQGWLAGDFSHDALANLHYIVEESKCKIVISSTWRHGTPLEEMKSWFKGIPLLEEAVIGKTTSEQVTGTREDKSKFSVNVPRGVEIDTWLNKHRVKTYRSNQFVILDDDSDMWPHHKNFVQTNGYNGLTHTDAIKAVGLFKKDWKDV